MQSRDSALCSAIYFFSFFKTTYTVLFLACQLHASASSEHFLNDPVPKTIPDVQFSENRGPFRSRYTKFASLHFKQHLFQSQYTMCQRGQSNSVCVCMYLLQHEVRKRRALFYFYCCSCKRKRGVAMGDGSVKPLKPKLSHEKGIFREYFCMFA